FAVFWRIAKFARLQQRGYERHMFVRAFFGEVIPDHEDFFRMAGLQFGASGYAPTGAGLHCDRIPRLAHAKAIKMSGFEIRYHLRRGHDDDAHVTVRPNAKALQPPAE